MRPHVESQVGAHRDECLLDPAYVPDDVDGLGELDDRVSDKLAGTVPGDLSAPVDVDHGGAVGGTVAVLGAPARGVDRGVFEQQQGVGSGAVGAGVEDLPLPLPRLEVPDRPEMHHGDRRGIGTGGRGGVAHVSGLYAGRVEAERPVPRPHNEKRGRRRNDGAPAIRGARM